MPTRRPTDRQTERKKDAQKKMITVITFSAETIIRKCASQAER